MFSSIIRESIFKEVAVKTLSIVTYEDMWGFPPEKYQLLKCSSYVFRGCGSNGCDLHPSGEKVLKDYEVFVL